MGDMCPHGSHPPSSYSITVKAATPEAKYRVHPAHPAQCPEGIQLAPVADPAASSDIDRCQDNM